MKRIKSILYPYLQRLKFIKLILLFNRAKKKPLEKKKLVMLSTSKGELGGNLKALKEYIENNALPYKISAFTCLNMPALKTLAAELAAAEFIIVDDYEPMVYPLTLREGQQLVQAWHALGAFKKFGYARATAEQNAITHKNYTKAAVSSPELTAIYARSFGISEDKIIPVGAPRTDYLFDTVYKASARARLIAKEPLLTDKKVVLFAPTFRGESVNDGYYPAEFINLEQLMSELSDDTALIIKLHPFIKNKIEIPASLKNRVFDFSDEREINDILLITDVLVTDYSSVIFENALTGGACVHYVPDLEEYRKGRGFYFAYEDYACGEIVKDKTALAAAINSASAGDERMAEFKNRFVSLCDGSSSKRFVEKILEEE